MNRPTAVTIIVIVQAIGGVLAIIEGIVILLGGGLLAFTAAGEDPSIGAVAAFITLLIALLPLVFGILSMVLCVAMFQLKSWAWLVTFVLEVIYLVLTILSLPTEDPDYLGLILSGVVIYCLRRPEVKRAFGR